MKWNLGLDKTIARNIPSVIRNPKNYQWLMALASPLETINKQFEDFADEKETEASLSSQTMILENYLNKVYKPQFGSPDTERIQIKHGIEEAQATFYDSETPPPNPPYSTGHMVVYNRAENLGVNTNSANNDYIAFDGSSVPTFTSSSQYDFKVQINFISDGVLFARGATNNDYVAIIRNSGDGSVAFQEYHNGALANAFVTFSITDDLHIVEKIGLDFYVDGIYISSFNDQTINISGDIYCGEFPIIGATGLLGQIISFQFNDVLFELNEGSGSAVFNDTGEYTGTIHTNSSDPNYIDNTMWGDSVYNDSPFIYFDYEDFGTLPEDFRVLLPKSVEGNESLVRGVGGIVDKYVIDTKKYDIQYSE